MNCKISFIVCTYNSPELVKKCLNSILKQKYKGKKEIIIVDGGSDKDTQEILNNYKKKFNDIKILHNKKKLPEGYGRGKWLGWKNCHGEFVFIIDQDNELQGENCINEMLKPFEKESIFGCACRLAVKPSDSLTNKYIALVGTDPFFAYRSLDGVINLRRIGEDRRDYTVITLDKDNILITGGNCFVYKKKYLDNVGGYTQDTENISKLIKSGYNKIGVSKKACTHHLATKGFLDFIKKKKKWARAYKQKRKEHFSYMPKNKKERKDFILNLFFILAVLPNLFIAIRQFVKTREKAWFLHPILTFITGFIYFFYTFTRMMFD